MVWPVFLQGTASLLMLVKYSWAHLVNSSQLHIDKCGGGLLLARRFILPYLLSSSFVTVADSICWEHFHWRKNHWAQIPTLSPREALRVLELRVSAPRACRGCPWLSVCCWRGRSSWLPFPPSWKLSITSGVGMGTLGVGWLPTL